MNCHWVNVIIKANQASQRKLTHKHAGATGSHLHKQTLHTHTQTSTGN